MTRPPTRRRRRKTRNPLLGMAVALMGMGVVLLVAGAMFRNHKLLAAVASAFNTPAALLMGLGAVLLAAHWFTRRGQAVEPALPPVHPVPGKPRRQPAQAQASVSPPNQPKAPFVLPDTRPPQEPPGPAQPAAPASTWSPTVFAAIEWHRFEAVCEALFAQAGFETTAQSHGADGGVDIWLHSKNAQGPVAVVQCKHWQNKPVGVKELREFLGAMASHGLKRGTYATTSTYTADAQAFARSNAINAMDGNDLLTLIATRTPEQQAALLAVAYEGEYWRPTCASCGIKLVERKPAKGGAPFWGCSNFPRCKTRIYKTSQT